MNRHIETARTTVAGRSIGSGQPTWIVAEFGVTHEGSLDVAVDMLEAAAKAGVDAVKVECIDADRLVSLEYRDKLPYSFSTLAGETLTMSYYELLQKVSLSYDDLAQLARMAAKRELPFFGTAFDLETVDFLKQIGACAVKISSGEITHHPLLAHAARSGLPVIFDTGRASLSEVMLAVEVLRQAGCATPIVMHNPSGYPAAPKDVSLALIPLYQQATGLPTGFSCHSRGNAMVHGAVAYGSNVIEKPLSRDNTLDEDEHIFSVNLSELGPYVADIRALEGALGLDRQKLYEGDTDQVRRRTFRQSLVAAQDLEPGRTITTADIAFARPGHRGFPPTLVDYVVGRRIKVRVPKGHHIEAGHLE